MEIGDAAEIYNRPIHPYTKSLLSAVPQPDPRSEKERRRVGYDQTMHEYQQDEKLELMDFGNNHLVYCSQKEYDSWTV